MAKIAGCDVLVKVNKAGTVVYLSINNEYKGYLLVSDKIKETSKS